jgi:hypothetical protein
MFNLILINLFKRIKDTTQGKKAEKQDREKVFRSEAADISLTSNRARNGVALLIASSTGS